MILTALSFALVVAAADASAPASPAPATTAAPAKAAKHNKTRVLVLDFKAVGVTDGEAALLRDAAASRIGRSDKLEVISTGEMKTLVDIEATKQQSGCDPVASGNCLAEIAGALGADDVVAGNVGKLGDSVVVNVTLLQSQKAEAVARSTITAATLDDALVKLGPEMDRFADLLGGGNGAGEPNPALFYSGAVVGGVGAIVTVIGAGWCASLEWTLEQTGPNADPKAKQNALDQSRGPALATLGAGLAVVAAGAVLVGVSYAVE